MKCPQCGTDNRSEFKFCVKCGTSLDEQQEPSVEHIDMGGYHSEEEAGSGGFSLGSGTFTISDRPPADSSSDFYTADELNDSDEEFDFSSFDEPFIPKLDTGRVTLPEQTQAVRQAQMNSTNPVPPQSPYGMQGVPQPGAMQGIPQPGAMQGIPQPGAMQGIPQPGAMQSIPQPGAMQGIPQPGAMQGIPQPGAMQGIPQSGAMQGIPQPGAVQMYAQPQIVGYDPSGMPIYGQPVMYAQPQIVGYDPGGMPIYGQPVMYAQPQIVGYDPSGMPIYGQPMMYGQQPQQMAGVPPMQGLMQGIPPQSPMPQTGGIPPVQGNIQQPAPLNTEKQDKVKVPDDFWEFFDGGKATEHAEADPDDAFFGKRGEDVDQLKRFGRKKVDYMNDTPLVDGSTLAKNEPAKFNKLYMKATELVNADDLEAKAEEQPQDIMGVTRDVDASDLNAYKQGKAWNIMRAAGEADAEELEAYNPEHKEAIMAQADHAVDALPKKPTTYNDEIDAIELPEHMQAKKTVNKDTPEIPGLPEF